MAKARILPARWLVHTVQVSTRLGTTGTGPAFTPNIPVRGVVSEKTRMVRAADGAEVVSSATITCQPGTEHLFKVGSQVVLPTGRKTRVLSTATHDAGALGAWSHVEVVCE